MSTIFTAAKIIAENYSPEKYHSENAPRGTKEYAIGRSSLMEFNRCPHRWVKGFEMDGTDATEFGSALDCLLLTPDRFALDYAVCPATYPDKKTGEEKRWTFAATFCKEWREEHSGAQIITADIFNDITGAVASAKEDKIIGPLLKCSASQVYITGIYHDESTDLDITVKTLIDTVPSKESVWKKSLWDLKSARNAAAGPWPRVIFERGYHVQAALSLDLYDAALPDEDRMEFCHAIIENVKPWEPGKRLLSEDFVTLGRATYRAALARYAQCLATGVWPGYDHESREFFQGCSISSPESWMANP